MAFTSPGIPLILTVKINKSYLAVIWFAFELTQSLTLANILFYIGANQRGFKNLAMVLGVMLYV